MEKIDNIFSKIFNDMNEKLFNKENGDYEKDGLIYCGICDRAKQKRKLIGSEEMIIPQPCKCKEEEIAKKKEEELNKKRKIIIEELRKKAFDDSLLINQTFNNDDGSLEHRKLGLNYVKKFEEMEKENIGLLLTGSVGTGKILGYSNKRKAIIMHVDKEDKGVTKRDTLGGKQDFIIINESGLYSLILSSRLKKAKEFKHWVTREVLPSIRKNGGYILNQENLSANAMIVKKNLKSY